MILDIDLIDSGSDGKSNKLTSTTLEHMYIRIYSNEYTSLLKIV